MTNLTFGLCILFSGLFLCIKAMTDILVYRNMSFQQFIITTILFIIGLAYSGMAMIVIAT